MVMNMMPHQHHPPTPSPHPNNHPPPPPPPPPPPQPTLSTTTKRSPSTTNSLSLVPLSSRDHVAIPLPPVAVAHASTESTPSLTIARVRLSDISTYDGAPSGQYIGAVDALAGSLTRHNSAVIELAAEDSTLMRCGLEAARLYLKTRGQSYQSGGGCSGGGNGKESVPPSRGDYMYRAGRAIEDWDSSPPCMAEVFKCMGKAARTALCAIARHLRLRSDGFMHLLDDAPLPANKESSSVLVASYSLMSSPNGKNSIGAGKQANGEVEKGLLTLISSDYPGLQVCDPNGRWYLADVGSSPGDLLLLTGKALSHVTAGLRPAGLYRAVPDNSSLSSVGGRTSLSFRLMPHVNAILDCTPIASAGHIIPQSYVPISVSQFMGDLSTEEDVFCQLPVSSCVAENKTNKEPTLRSVLSDPLSGAFLEDAMLVSCGHSFGGLMLKKVIEMLRCTICNAEIDSSCLTPNHVLRAAATAVKHEDDKRLFHNATLRKRRKEMGGHPDTMRRLNRENGENGVDNGLHRGVQYPFAVNEKVMIEGNKRTPEKFVGKEAIITSQCLNGWYLLKIIGSGENVRLQYRSLRKIQISEAMEDRCPPQLLQNGGS